MDYGIINELLNIETDRVMKNENDQSNINCCITAGLVCQNRMHVPVRDLA